MDVTAGLAAALATLSQAVDDSDCDEIDVEQLLEEFAHTVKLGCAFLGTAPSSDVDSTEPGAVSYLGMSVRVATVVGAFCSTAMAWNPDGGAIATSLHLPLKAGADAQAPNTVTIYAGKAGAFVDLAADLGWILTPHRVC